MIIYYKKWCPSVQQSQVLLILDMTDNSIITTYENLQACKEARPQSHGDHEASSVGKDRPIVTA
jgi:hypothetical protein